MKISLLFALCIVVYSVMIIGCASYTNGDFDAIKNIDYEAQKDHVVVLEYTVIKDGEKTLRAATGFCISETKILTNKHVVEGITKLQIYLHNNTHLQGNVVAISKNADLATVEITGGCVPTTITQKPVMVGEKVHMIAHPLRVFTWTTNFGHISSVKRRVFVDTQSRPKKIVDYEEFFQYDISTAMGTSGGPIFRGNKVDGVMSMLAGEESDQMSNIGFAIPASVICKFIDCEDSSEEF